MANIYPNYLQVVTKDTLESRPWYLCALVCLPLWDYWCTSQTEPFSIPLAAWCKILGHFSIDHQHFGGIEEAAHFTCDTSTHRDRC